MTQLQKKNLLLPDVERISIPTDDAANLAEITECLKEIEDEAREIVDQRVLERCLRLINTRRSLKYVPDKDQLSRVVDVFHHVLINKRISFPMRSKLLAEMQKTCKKRAPHIQLTLKPIDWRTLWKDATDVACRTKKDQSMASEQPIITYMSRLVEFLHASRRFLISDVAAADALVLQCMEMLKDYRHAHCIDGLLLLVNCLPTDYPHYAQWLPKWVELWSTMSHNAQWDMCWLTLLTRARKHTDVKAFDWKALMPLFTLKARELMNLPMARGKKYQYSEFPFVFPVYYGKLMTNQVDANKIALNKVAKLIYFASLHEYLETLPTGASAGAGSGSGPRLVAVEPLTITPPSLTDKGLQGSEGGTEVVFPGFSTGEEVLAGVADVVLFFQSTRAFYYASASGAWAQNLAYFTSTFVGEHSRHVGRALGARLVGSSTFAGTSACGVNSGSKYFAFEAPLHAPTVRYMGGLLTLLSLEGLYGKNNMTSQYCSSNLKNLCAVDPALGHIVVPFLLRALDPSAVNQTHQAPIAMHTLSVIFKPLLFPRPVMLRYLPLLLRLVLPGVDPCDAAKTSVTLKLLSTILSWVSLKSTYSKEDATSTAVPYLHTLAPTSSLTVCGISEGDDRQQAHTHLNALAAVFGDWALSLLDKMFLLLEAHEAPQQKKKESPIDGAVGETVGYLLQGVDPLADPALWNSLEQKILQYFAKSTPLNAAKASAKMVDALVNANPPCIARVLPAILDKDVLSLSCSQDKLAFRLRLAGGALRSCQAAGGGEAGRKCLEEVVLPLVLPVISSTQFTQHTEKPVRKSACKLAKELIKGLSSFYPRGVRPVYQGGCVGGPNSLESAQSSFYVPPPYALVAVSQVLRATAVQSMQDIILTLQTLSTAATGSATPASIKKVEESIQHGLKVIQKTIRGAAEVLGDEYKSGAFLTIPAVPVATGSDTGSGGEIASGASGPTVDEFSASEEEGLGPEGGRSDGRSVVSTGRDEVLSALAGSGLPSAAADCDLLAGLRFTVLEFLTYVIQTVKVLSAPASATQTVGSTAMVVEVSSGSAADGSATMVAGASVTVEGAYGGLFNSAAVQAGLIKTYLIVVNFRMAGLKAVAQIQSWYTATKRATRSLLVKTLMKRCRAQGTVAGSGVNAGSVDGAGGMEQLDYWLGHDLNTNVIANGGWILHARRERHFSIAVNRLNLKDDSKGALLVGLLREVVDLCCHEYDLIRSKALKVYVNVAGRFGWTSFDLVRPLAARTASRGTPFSVITGTLSLLAQDRCVRYVTSQWHLTNGFMRMFFKCPAAIAAVLEQDKRQRLQTKLAHLFVLYVDNWHHFPLTAHAAASAADLMTALLGSVGYAASGKALDTPAPLAVGVTAEGAGLRQETFVAFVLLHFMGHRDVMVPPGALAWAMQTLCTAHGQPTQNVALSALVRCSVAACKQLVPNALLLKASDQPAPTQPHHLTVTDAVAQYVPFLRHALGTDSTKGDEAGWGGLLLGLSQALPKAAEDGLNAQWSAGIDQVLRCAHYMRLVLPRKMTNARTDQALFSTRFRPEVAALFVALTVLLTQDGPGTGAGAMPLSDVISFALAASRSLPSTSEEEAKANNVARAELFAGLLRGLTSLPAHTPDQEAQLVAAEESLVAFFTDCVEKLSVDYFAHWAEGVNFAMSGGRFVPSGPLCTLVMDGLRRVLRPSSSSSSSSVVTMEVTASATVASNGGTTATAAVAAVDEEGLVRQGRALTLARAALGGEITAATLGLCDASASARAFGTECPADAPLGVLIAQLLCDPDSDVLSSFRNCRLELGKLFSVLTEVHGPAADGSVRCPALTPVLVKLATAAAAAYDIEGEAKDKEDTSSGTGTGSGAGAGAGAETGAGTGTGAGAGAGKTPAQVAAKNAIETACAWSQFLSQVLPARSLALLPPSARGGSASGESGGGSGGLLSVVLAGSGHAETEVAAICGETCFLQVHSALGGGRTGLASSTPAPSDSLSVTLAALNNHRTHPSFHVRQVVILASTMLMVENWFCLRNDEKKIIKDMFAEALHDSKPEVQLIAVAGMVAVLSYKPFSELKVLADTYVKNSDIFAARESKKRKADKAAGVNGSAKDPTKDATAKPDKVHATTVLMMACVIQALPYDLPPFVPALLTSFVRHVTVPSLKDVVTRTVQMFKSTHQDRWETDFKHCFTREQLEDLQGAGAAHYFS